MKQVASGSRMLIACGALLALGSAGGCAVEAHDTVIVSHQAAMSVDWTIDGDTSADRCNAYDIEVFNVIVDGPDAASSFNDDISCRTEDWAVDYTNLTEGFYDITITPYDSADVPFTAIGGNGVDVIDTGSADVLTFDFTDTDFQ